MPTTMGALRKDIDGVRIQTVLGAISPDSVRQGLLHEHVIVHPSNPARIAPRYYREVMEQTRRAVTRNWRNLVEHGCNTIVEATVCNRRYPELYRQLSLATGMNVIAATGHYAEFNLSDEVKKSSPEALAARMEKEIRTGIYKTDIRAGIIKVSSGSWDLTPNEQKTFHAAVLAARKTGAPVTTHSYPGLGNHAKYFAGAKVPSERVALGHADACSWIENMAALKLGFRLLFTNIGGNVVLPEDIIALQIAHLVRKGFVKQLLLGSDYCLFVRKQNLVPYFPHPPAYVFENFIPRLIKNGVKAGQIDQMLTDNVREFLSFRLRSSY